MVAVMLRLTSTLLVLLGLIGLLPASVSAQGGGNRAALVVRAGDGSVQTKCVSFSEPAISGEGLLNRSGMTVVINSNSGQGGAVCSINGYGCAFPTQDCFCKCQGKNCEYWAYYHWVGGAWQYSQVGATGYQVKNGALEGWSWGQGNFSSGTIPPTVKFEDICTSPTATPTVTATPTRTPSPTPTTVVASLGQTATPVPASSNPPEVQFDAAASTVKAGTCTVLQWVTWDAQQISLDGAAVAGQDRREVCPQTTQRYVLTASNSAGQARRELTISVVGAAQPTQPVPSTVPPAPPVGSNSQTSPLSTPIATRPAESTARPIPTPLPQPPAPSAAAAPSAAPLGAVVHAQSAPIEMPTRPPAAMSVAVAVPTLDLSSLLTPTATRAAVRRPVAEGQATPTPILMARVGSGDDPARPGPNTSSTSTQRPSTPDRGFRMSLLPGYGAYVLMAAMLVGTGAVVVRRKRET
jgi:hypothetical protein